MIKTYKKLVKQLYDDMGITFHMIFNDQANYIGIRDLRENINCWFQASEKLPYNYVIALFCHLTAIDLLKNYDFKCDISSPYNYLYELREQGPVLNRESEYLLLKLAWNYKEMGAEYFIEWYDRSKNYIRQQYDAGLLVDEALIEYGF